MKMQFLNSFRMKALLFMIPVLIFMSLIFTYQSIKNEKDITRKEIIKRAETITTLATKTGELPILSGNPELLQSTVSFLRANSEVSSVTFYDKAMILLIHDGAPVSAALPAMGPDLPVSMTEETDSFVFYAPVHTVRTQEEYDIFEQSPNVKKVEEIIGWIRLSFSKSSMKENERIIVVRGLTLAVVFTLGSCLIVYFLISMATRPLVQIAQVADNISHGDFSREIRIDQGDEIGTLARTFSSMKSTIQQVLGETDALIVAVRKGRLETRSDARVFEGEWRTLVDGVNNLTDSFAKVHGELRIAKDAAESASRAKSDFLSSMSHELRTPLNAIMGYAQILKRQGNLTETQQQQLEIMHSSGEHLLTLINDILDVGKIEAGKMELENASFDLSALMRQVYNLTRLQAEEKDLRFHYETSSPLPDYVWGDERKLRQILLNLLSNAVKCTRHGDVILRVGYHRTASGLFLCEVHDTGVGIPPDKLETIFEPFTQLVANRQVREGTGLGLNITRHLAEMMQGKVGVKSTLGKGSMFWVEVPLSMVAEGGIVLERTENSIIGYEGKRKSILVVDDNISNTSMLVSLLEPLGFSVATAENGEIAIRHAEEHRPDLVLFDLVMPEKDGLATLKEMRQNKEWMAIRFIGTSATVTDTLFKQEFAAACDDFVVKPIRIDQLLEKIRVLLSLAWKTATPESLSATIRPERERGKDPVTVPPLEDLKELYDLAMRGDLQRIEAWAGQLKEREKKYGEFSTILCELTGGFRVSAILNLVERYIKQGE